MQCQVFTFAAVRCMEHKLPLLWPGGQRHCRNGKKGHEEPGYGAQVQVVYHLILCFCINGDGAVVVGLVLAVDEYRIHDAFGCKKKKAVKRIQINDR